MIRILNVISFFFVINIAYAQNKKELSHQLQQQVIALDSLQMVINSNQAKIAELWKGNSEKIGKIVELNSEIKKLKLEIRNLNDSLSELIKINNSNIKIEDIDGNNYDVLKINSLKFLNGPLKVTHFSDGTPILISNNKEEFIENTINEIPTYCYVKFDNKYFNKGLIYNKYCWLNDKQLAPVGFEVIHENIFDSAFKDDQLYENLIIYFDYFFTHSDKLWRLDKWKSELGSDQKFVFEHTGFSRSVRHTELEGIVLLPAIKESVDPDDPEYFCACRPGGPNYVEEGKNDIIFGLPVFCCKSRSY